MAYRFRKPRLVPTLAVLITTALLMGLGFWQLGRLAWKKELLATIEQAQSEPPRDLLFYPPQELARNEWRNIVATGRFLYDKELYATPRYLKEQMGYGILTPLAVTTPSGVRYLLVNRGWVPPAKKDASTRTAGNPAGRVTVEGVIRSHLDRGWLWRKFFANLPEKNVWVWYDLPAMEKQTGLAFLPVMIDATRVTAEGGRALKDGPTPFPLEINIRNDHLGYAITWFLIGFSCLALFLIYHREPQGPAGTTVT